MKVSNAATGISLIKVMVILESMLMIIPVTGNLFNSIINTTQPKNTDTAPALQVPSLTQAQ